MIFTSLCKLYTCNDEPDGTGSIQLDCKFLYREFYNYRAINTWSRKKEMVRKSTSNEEMIRENPNAETGLWTMIKPKTFGKIHEIDMGTWDNHVTRPNFQYKKKADRLNCTILYFNLVTFNANFSRLSKKGSPSSFKYSDSLFSIIVFWKCFVTRDHQP